jgi:hypothetical protein
MTTHKGIRYFPTYQEAEAFAQAAGVIGYRLVSYIRGWAIQIRISGPYL